MSKFKKTVTESKTYSKDVMNEIASILDKKKVKYKSKHNNTEFIVDTDMNANKMRNLIYKNTYIPKIVLNLLIDIVCIDEKIYIRQNTR